MTDQWHWWREALAGRFGDTTPGTPMSGFYRHRRRAIAIWRDDDGALLCSVTHGDCPSKADEIDDLFSFACRYPIPWELYEQVRTGGEWPREYLVDLRLIDIQHGIPWTVDYAAGRLAAQAAKEAKRQQKERTA